MAVARALLALALLVASCLAAKCVRAALCAGLTAQLTRLRRAPPKTLQLKPDPRISLKVPSVPLYHDGAGCLTANKTAGSCSGNGQCVRDPAKYFGVARVVTRRSGWCDCQEGWMGPGCAVPLSAIGRRQRIRMLAAGWVKYDAFKDKWTQTEKGARVPRYVFLATHYGPTGTNKTHYKRGGVVVEPDHPFRGDLHSWVQPRAEESAAAGRLFTEWQRQSGEVGVDTVRDYHKGAAVQRGPLRPFPDGTMPRAQRLSTTAPRPRRRTIRPSRAWHSSRTGAAGLFWRRPSTCTSPRTRPTCRRRPRTTTPSPSCSRRSTLSRAR
jgi:hypothetical protein